MSMVVIKDGVIAADKQMLVNCGTRIEYREPGTKLFKDSAGRFVIGAVGSDMHKIDLALIQTLLNVRLAAFYLNYDDANPLEFTDEEAMILTGYANGLDRRFYVATAEHAWFIMWKKDEKHLEVKPESITVFNGTGSELVIANVFHKAGCSAVEIIQRIGRLTGTCGFGHDSFHLNRLKKFDRSVPTKKTRTAK